MDKKKMTHYQHRVTKLVWAGNIYSVVCPIALLYFGSTVVGWIVYASTMILHYSLAAGLDALFDSLSERVNIQSSWLDVRLSVLEPAVNANAGQDAWRKNGVPTNDVQHYFYNYPERLV